MKKLNADEIQESVERGVFILPFHNIIEEGESKRYIFIVLVMI